MLGVGCLYSEEESDGDTCSDDDSYDSFTVCDIVGFGYREGQCFDGMPSSLQDENK